MWWCKDKFVDEFNNKNEQWQKITRVEDLPETLDPKMTTFRTLIHFMALLYKENRRLYNELKER